MLEKVAMSRVDDLTILIRVTNVKEIEVLTRMTNVELVTFELHVAPRDSKGDCSLA